MTPGPEHVNALRDAMTALDLLKNKFPGGSTADDAWVSLNHETRAAGQALANSRFEEFFAAFRRARTYAAQLIAILGERDARAKALSRLLRRLPDEVT